MFIRRKVFSLLQDENGEERYFSTTEFEDERLYAVKDIDSEKAPLTARTDIRQSNKTKRQADYLDAAVEDNKDRRSHGLTAKMVENAKDTRKSINEYAADRRKSGLTAKMLENAKDYRKTILEDNKDRRARRNERQDRRLKAKYGR